MPEKIISVVVPIFNEEHSVPIFFQKIVEVLSSLLEKYDYEVIAVDDGSIDGSQKLLEELVEKNTKFRYIQFSRNFGKEIALSAGLDVAQGDAVIMIDADMQHPIELIPEFILKWENGAEVVVGVRKKNSGEGWVKKYGSFLFYKIMDIIGETKIIPRSTDYRLIDKKVVKEFRRFTEHSRITRGLIDWLGFKRDYIYFEANKRISGEARYGKLKLFKLALSAFVTHSLLPLKLAGYLGAMIVFVFGTGGLLLFVGKYLFHNQYAMSFTGTAQLAILIIFLVGVMLSCLGLVALYIGTIKDDVANRPKYVVRKSSFDQDL